MAENSNIEWTNHTANLWWGCDKIRNNPCCDNCYAESLSKFRNKNRVWGHDVPRRGIKSIWKNLSKWQNTAASKGIKNLVFTMSMGDIFEKSMPLEKPLHGPNGVLWTKTEELRNHLFAAISNNEFPNLIFQMLTKRPQNVNRMVPKAWLQSWPKNVWIGTSAGDQENIDRLVPELIKIPAHIRFLSIEPLLEAVDLSSYLAYNCLYKAQKHTQVFHNATLREDQKWHGEIDENGVYTAVCDVCHQQFEDGNHIHQVIVGGESGPKARLMNIEWARHLRDQCKVVGIPFFMKQMGGKRKPFPSIPDDLMIREFPTT